MSLAISSMEIDSMDIDLYIFRAMLATILLMMKHFSPRNRDI